MKQIILFLSLVFLSGISAFARDVVKSEPDVGFKANAGTEAFNHGQPADSLLVGMSMDESFTIHYPEEKKAVEPHFSEPRPNPARDFTLFDYTLPFDARSARLEIRDLTGTTVMAVPLSLSGNQIRIETQSLKNGLYLYSFLVNEQIIMTRKLIIKR